ncbi:MAG: VIT domain-containing protein [Pseudomonadota bacterium]
MKILVGALVILSAGLAHADSAAPAGVLEVVVDGQIEQISALNLAYRVELSGDLAQVTLRQEFANPYTKPVNARYLFPLNRKAAVYAMRMEVGDEVIEAQIQEKQQAAATFEKAKAQGKAAALLTQHRPNMFTQKVANLMPGQPLSVELAYSQEVLKVDGAYELVIPMVVGPRYVPKMQAHHLDTPPAYAPVGGLHVPPPGERVTLHIELETPLAIDMITSPTHQMNIRHVSSTQAEVSLAAGHVRDDRDFVFRYSFAPSEPEAGVLSHFELGEGGYFSLLIEPPAVDHIDVEAIPREMVFVLDCSGSMAGLPMQASKAFMRLALRQLRPDDSFRIIRFSDRASEFTLRPQQANSDNVAAGIRYVEHLFGGGGTEMSAGIRQALQTPVQPGHIRNVVFLTDGYIGNEYEILKLIKTMLGDSRLFAFGVGSGVNRFLLAEMARQGRGFLRVLDASADKQDVSAQVADLAARLRSPVLTNIRIDWGELDVHGITPERVPDLYAGDSIRISGRFRDRQSGVVEIQGRTPAGNLVLPLVLGLENTDQRPAIRRLWARGRVAELMHSFTTPDALRDDGMDDEQLRASVTDLGLAYALATRWTSFVAVSRKRYNDRPEGAMDTEVALPRVAGVSAKAYASAVTGYAAPEPAVWISLLALAGLAIMLRRRQAG